MQKGAFYCGWLEDPLGLSCRFGAHSSSGGRWHLPKCQNALCSVVARTWSLIDIVLAWNVGAYVAWRVAETAATFRCYVNELLSSWSYRTAQKCNKTAFNLAHKSQFSSGCALFHRHSVCIMKKQFWEFAGMLEKQTRSDITCHNICDPDMPSPFFAIALSLSLSSYLCLSPSF